MAAPVLQRASVCASDNHTLCMIDDSNCILRINIDNSFLHIYNLLFSDDGFLFCNDEWSCSDKYFLVVVEITII